MVIIGRNHQGLHDKRLRDDVCDVSESLGECVIIVECVIRSSQLSSFEKVDKQKNGDLL